MLFNQTVVRIGTLTSRAKMNHIMLENETICGVAKEQTTGYIKLAQAGRLKHYPVHCKKCLKQIQTDTSKTLEEQQAIEIKIKKDLSNTNEENAILNKELRESFYGENK